MTVITKAQIQAQPPASNAPLPRPSGWKRSTGPRFALLNLFTSITGTMIRCFDTLILIFMVSLDIVAVYNAMLPTALILSYVGAAFSAVFIPMASERWAKQNFS